MLLGNKNAVIYGAGGSIGGAVAKEFGGGNTMAAIPMRLIINILFSGQINL